MTLHQTADAIKKVGIWGGLGIGVIVLIMSFFRVGDFAKKLLYPDKIAAPNEAFGALPPIKFTQNITDQKLTYTLNTISGSLPDFPDRLRVYPLVHKVPNLLNLQDTKNKVRTMGLINDAGVPFPEIPLGNANYEWYEYNGLRRKVIFNIVTFNFRMTSDYLSIPSVLDAQNLPTTENAIKLAQSFLQQIQLWPDDIDLTKTQKPDPSIVYETGPQIYSIQGGVLTPATSFSKTQVIRVDIYQKNVDYNLTAAYPGSNNKPQTVKMSLPILYPHPPYSTMSFWIASSIYSSGVMSAEFLHQTIDTTAKEATYPIKTAQQAFDELKAGKAYIANYYAQDKQVLINNVYLAYYLGEQDQEYMTPIIVFEGPKGFLAFVSAISDKALKKN